MFKIKEQSR